MKKINLGCGKYAKVDNEDYKRLNKHKWFAVDTGTNIYAYRRAKVNNVNTIIYMHREITKCPKGLCVDHINGDSLDNRKENLRIGTWSQNAMNRAGNSKSGYKGVSYKKGDKKWRARASINGESTYFGLYKNKKDAARVYDYIVYNQYGEFAHLNFKDELLSKKEFKKIYNKRNEESSKYSGVCKKDNGWQAYLPTSGTNKYIGYYSDEIDAAKAYDKYILDNKCSLDKYKLNFHKGHLEGTKIYLAGAIEKVSDKEATKWRDSATIVLENMGVEVLDPTRKNIAGGFNEIGAERKKINALKKAGKWKKFREIFKKIAHIDLRDVDRSNCVIAYMPQDVPMIGTVNEVVVARQQKKQVLIFTDCPKSDVNSWLLWLVGNEYVFENFGQIIKYLKKQTVETLTYNL